MTATPQPTPAPASKPVPAPAPQPPASGNLKQGEAVLDYLFGKDGA
jgi:hypothetical protein